MEKKNTDELLENLKNARDIKTFLKENRDSIDELTFGEYFSILLKKKQLPRSFVANNSNMTRTYVYDVLADKKQPGRDKVILMALATGLELDETRRLLKLSRNGDLYPKIERDALLIYAIINGLTIAETNEKLYENGYDILS